MDATLQDLREQVIAANAARKPLRVRGSGTKDFYGERFDGEVLDVRHLTGIIEYEPSELVLTARCGTPLSEIETALEARGQFLAFEPPHFGGDPTIGGVVASGLSGPRRMQAGAVRDFVLGAALIDAQGELLRFGGKVMKNVAGFDVSRLLCGSLGILGILAEVSLKVLPRPRAERTLQLSMPAGAAVEAFNRWAGQPLPISAAAWHAGTAWLRLSGAAPAVLAARERIGGDLVDDQVAQQWWDGLRHLRHPIFASDSLWRVSIPSTAPQLDLPGDLLIDWGGGLRWYGGDRCDVDVRRLASTAGGTATRWRGPAPQGRFHPLSPTAAAIHRRLKQRFDPNGIFNPGRLIPDL